MIRGSEEPSRIPDGAVLRGEHRAFEPRSIRNDVHRFDSDPTVPVVGDSLAQHRTHRQSAEKEITL